MEEQRHWYESVYDPDVPGWQAQVWHWDADGERPISVYLSPELYDTEGEALDDAVAWCEQNDIEAELA